jgi:hypothetical protein
VRANLLSLQVIYHVLQAGDVTGTNTAVPQHPMQAVPPTFCQKRDSEYRWHAHVFGPALSRNVYKASRCDWHHYLSLPDLTASGHELTHSLLCSRPSPIRSLAVHVIKVRNINSRMLSERLSCFVHLTCNGLISTDVY